MLTSEFQTVVSNGILLSKKKAICFWYISNGNFCILNRVSCSSILVQANVVFQTLYHCYFSCRQKFRDKNLTLMKTSIFTVDTFNTSTHNDVGILAAVRELGEREPRNRQVHTQGNMNVHVLLTL